MRIIWDELESYKPDPMCTCDPKCMCDGLSSVMERKKQDREMSFLRGLNDQFNMVRSNVLMMDPLPSIAKVFSCVVQQERRISSNDLMGGDNLINATSSTIPLNLCTYCGKDNHIVDRCFRRMVFLQIMFPKEEEIIKVARAEGVLVEEEARYSHILVSPTTLLMSVTKSMDILLDTSSISLKA